MMVLELGLLLELVADSVVGECLTEQPGGVPGIVQQLKLHLQLQLQLYCQRPPPHRVCLHLFVRIVGSQSGQSFGHLVELKIEGRCSNKIKMELKSQLFYIL